MHCSIAVAVGIKEVAWRQVLCVTSLGPGSFSYAPDCQRSLLAYDLRASAAQADPSFVANFQWHTDNSYEQDPAAATMLYVKRLPAEAHSTSLTDMIAAYDALPPSTKARLAGLVVPHFSGPGILAEHMRAKYGDRWNTATIVAGKDDRKMSRSQREFLGSPRHLLARPHPVVRWQLSSRVAASASSAAVPFSQPQ